jgi:hypothetical protein
MTIDAFVGLLLQVLPYLFLHPRWKVFTDRYELTLETICRFLLGFKRLKYAKNVQKQDKDIERDSNKQQMALQNNIIAANFTNNTQTPFPLFSCVD